MPRVAIVGGGPAGLQTALLVAKNGLDATVFDADRTPMHGAHLFNYLGVQSIDGTGFLERARSQVDEYGARRVGAEVTDVERAKESESEESDDDGASEGEDAPFFVHTADGTAHSADYLVLATGRDRHLADHVGCDRTADGTVDVDLNMRTSTERVYAVGWVVRAEKIQAAISVGDGAAAALDILSDVRGEPIHDFDTA